MSENFRIHTNTFNPDGSINRTNGMVLVGNIPVKYKSFKIVYSGKIPEGSSIPEIIVDEHTTVSRSGWKTTNHGFKVKSRINYNDGKYYKTSKKVVESIEQEIQLRWASIRRQSEMLELRNLAFKTMVEKYPNSVVSFSQKGEITVANQNGTKIFMGYNKKDDQVVYTVFRVEFPKEINVDFLIEQLGNI